MGIDDARAVIDAIGDVAALQSALDAGGSPDVRAADGRAALEVAIESDQVASLRQLIEAGADVNTANSEGWTPLHMAADYEGDSFLQNQVPMDLRFVRLLLDADAGPAAHWNTQGATTTPIDIARDYGHMAAVEAMEEALHRRNG